METTEYLSRIEQMEVNISAAQLARAKALPFQALLWLGLLLVFAVGASLFAYRFAKKKPAFYLKNATPKVFHYSMMGVSAVLLVLQWEGLSTGGSFWMLMVSAAVFLVAVIGLFRWERWGAGAEILFLWLTLPVKELPIVLLTLKDLGNLSPYSAAGKTAVVTFGELIVTRLWVYALIASVLTVLLIAYYLRRRLLFRSVRRKELDDLSFCPRCGAVLTGEGDFCPGCGFLVKGLPYSQANGNLVRSGGHCPKCGRELKDGKCSFCDRESVKEEIIGAIRQEAGGQIKGIIAMVLAAVLIFVPVLFFHVEDSLTEGSTDACNAFTQRLVDLHNDPSLAGDSSFLQGLSEDVQTLYSVNDQGFAIPSGRIGTDFFPCYAMYLEASYTQNAVAEEIYTRIAEGNVPSAEALYSAYDESINAQNSALLDPLSRVRSGDLLTKAEKMVLDSFRFWVSLPGVLAVSMVLGILGLIGLVYALFKRKEKVELFSVRARREITPEEGLQRQRYLVSERKLTRLGTLIGVGLLVVCFVVGMLQEAASPAEPSLSERTQDVYVEDGAELMEILGAAETGSGSVLNAGSEALETIAEMRGHLEAIILAEDPGDWTPEELSQEQELARSLLSALNTLEGSLKAGETPEKDLTVQVMGLIQEGMKSSAERTVQEALEGVQGLFS